MTRPDNQAGTGSAGVICPFYDYFHFLHSLAWKGPIKIPIKNLMINNVKSVLTPNPQIAACDRPKYDMIMQGNRLYGRGTIYRPWRSYISWDKIIYIVHGRLM